MVSLQRAKDFYDQHFSSASYFDFIIRRSKTADLVRNLVYIILEGKGCFSSKSGETLFCPLYNNGESNAFCMRCTSLRPGSLHAICAPSTLLRCTKRRGGLIVKSGYLPAVKKTPAGAQPPCRTPASRFCFLFDKCAFMPEYIHTCKRHCLIKRE